MIIDDPVDDECEDDHEFDCLEDRLEYLLNKSDS
jgi:hypothetical protein